MFYLKLNIVDWFDYNIIDNMIEEYHTKSGFLSLHKLLQIAIIIPVMGAGRKLIRNEGQNEIKYRKVH